MSARPLQLDQLLARVLHDPASLVVTPTTRAATAFRRAYDDAQRTSGLTLWSPANVLSWSQFLSTLWTQLVLAGHDDRLLLNSTQEHLVWCDLIAADKSTTTLTPVDSLATLSASAWSLASAYRATTRIRAAAATEDTRTFATWAEEFLRRCGHDRLLASAGLEAALEDHLVAGRLAAPTDPLILCGLSDLTPSQRSLLSALDDADTRIEPIDLFVQNPSARTTLLPDEHTELRFAIRHLRAHLEANPEQTAALIVPGLDAERPNLEPVLIELLAPELEDIAQDTSTTPWELTSAAPLTDTPLVSSLLDIAQWLRGALPLDRISSLLLSPYFNTCVPQPTRARFDAHVLQRQLLLRPELDLRSVLDLAREKSPDLILWLSALNDFSHELADGPLRRSYADWSEFFRLLTQRTGWPGPRSLTAAEHEITLAFDAVLDLLATLDFTGRKITFSDALDALERQLTLTPTPIVPSAARLLILTPAETQGLTFDYAIFLRATDANLPAHVRPNPLLDWTLQRSFAMPGADLEQTNLRARESLRHVLAATANLLFTSAAHSDTSALRPSTLPATLDIPALPSPVSAEAEPTPIPLEVFEDSAALPPPPSTEISGGSRLLKLQAACGFLAFAELRLNGQEIESQDDGFDARESGNVLHRALESFWNEVKTQSTLIAMNQMEREDALIRAIELSFDETLRLRNSWDLAYIALQKERLLQLLRKWLNFELERGPFTVQRNEERVRIQVGPLTLKLRMDRVDELPDGGFVLVDYKTGLSAHPNTWATDRPDEPQLPLYTLLTNSEDLRGVAFGRIRAGDSMQWLGYASDPGILPEEGSRLVDIATVTDEWRTVLTQLAQDFYDGKSFVSPKDHTVTCKRCAQRLLCRLDVSALTASLENSETSDD